MKQEKKLPIVTYETVITINGKRFVQTSMSYTESVGEAILEGWLENDTDEIIAHVNQDN